MDDNKKEIGIKVIYKEEEIPVEELTVILDFDGEEAKVDLKNAVIRSMVLAQENVILKNAINEIKTKIGGGKVVAPQRFYESDK